MSRLIRLEKVGDWAHNYPWKHKEFRPRGPLKQKPNYSVLTAGLTALNGLTCLAIAIFYLIRPAALQGLIQVELAAGLALIAVLYYGSIHRIVRRLHEAVSTLVLAIISLLNLTLVIAQTGGLDSPLYALWLLVIVGSGLFGTPFTAAILGATVLAHVAVLAQHSFNGAYFSSHIIQLLISLAAGALAEWVYYRGTLSHKQANTLSGKLTQEQLKAEALMSSMADGVIVVDQDRQIQLINKAAQDLTGWNVAAAQGLDYRLILKLKNARGEETSEANDPFNESWAKKTSVVRNDLLCTTRNDKNIELSVSVSPIYDNNHQITGGIAVFRDISHEKAVERTRNEFVSTASHEMRTPVAAIEGYVSLAMNAKVATIDDRAKGYLEKAHLNTQHLGALFRDLLSVTKLDEGLIAHNLVAVNLTKMLQDITNDMQFAASKKSLSITFMPSAPYGPKMLVPSFWVMVDAERMREVIMNLIENGMKFTSEGGITIGIKGDDKTITASVSDTGIGIPAEDIPHLFQKFYRVDNSATRTIGGTGLGLYLVRTLIEVFNGRIWIESQFGKGSTILFTLPRISAPNVATAPAESSASSAPLLPSTPAPSLVPFPAAGQAATPINEPTAPVPSPVIISAPSTPTPATVTPNRQTPPVLAPQIIRPSLTDIRPMATISGLTSAVHPAFPATPTVAPQTVVAPQ